MASICKITDDKKKKVLWDPPGNLDNLRTFSKPVRDDEIFYPMISHLVFQSVDVVHFFVRETGP